MLYIEWFSKPALRLLFVHPELKSHTVSSRAATAVRTCVFTRPHRLQESSAVARTSVGLALCLLSSVEALGLLEFAGVSARDRADVQDALPFGPAKLFMGCASNYPGAIAAYAAVLTRPFPAASAFVLLGLGGNTTPTRCVPAARVRAQKTPRDGCGTYDALGCARITLRRFALQASSDRPGPHHGPASCTCLCKQRESKLRM